MAADATALVMLSHYQRFLSFTGLSGRSVAGPRWHVLGRLSIFTAIIILSRKGGDPPRPQ